jgi:hypothetical protein
MSLLVAVVSPQIGPSPCASTTFTTLLKPSPVPCYGPLSLPEGTR